MKCKLCSFNWCWLCSKECLDDHYTNQGPCQGKQYDEGDMDMDEENLFIANLLYNNRDNPIINFIIYPLLCFFLYNSLITNTSTSSRNQRNRNRIVGNEDNFPNEQEGYRADVNNNQLNNNNYSNNLNEENINYNPINRNQEVFLNTDNNKNNNNIPNNLNIDSQNQQNIRNNEDIVYEDMGCLEKCCLKFLLIFTITILTVVLTVMTCTFNMFNVYPIYLIVERFPNDKYGLSKCFAISSYVIYYLISFPFGAVITLAYFACLVSYSYIKIIIS